MASDIKLSSIIIFPPIVYPRTCAYESGRDANTRAKIRHSVLQQLLLRPLVSCPYVQDVRNARSISIATDKARLDSTSLRYRSDRLQGESGTGCDTAQNAFPLWLVTEPLAPAREESLLPGVMKCLRPSL